MSAIELCAVLDDIRRAVADYVILPEHGPVVIALWCAHTYLLDEFGHTPRLAFMAPDRACGKTRGLEVIQPLVYKPEPSSNISAAALYRVIEAERPTLLIDEVDSFLSRRDDPIVNILNSGHARAMAYVRRCEGDSHEPTKFSTWSAVAFAGIGALPDTLASRSIIIPMRRRLPEQTVKSMRGANGLADLGKRLQKHTTSSVEAMRAARPAMPAALVDRDADNWLPLLTIAEVAQDGWPALARAAAVGLQNGTRDRPESSGEMLLSDIRDLFNEKGVEAMFSESIVEELEKLEHRPWADGGGRNQPITKHALARLLRHYGVSPDDVRIGQEVKKGYKRAWFEETWRRFLGEKKTGEATADSQPV